MRRGLLLVALMLVLASLQASASQVTTTTTLPHAAVTIASNADFTSSNGVVSGSGSMSDPYVISGWRFTGNIVIRDTTAAFVVRDNLFDGTTLTIQRIRAPGEVANNEFRMRSTASAILLLDASPSIHDNSFLGTSPQGTGVRGTNTNAAIYANTFNEMATAVSVETGAVNVSGNDIHQTRLAIYLKTVINARVELNIVTDCDTNGVQADYSTNVTIGNNTITACGQYGVALVNIKDVLVANNTIRLSAKVGVWIESSSGNVSANVIIDGRGDGIDVWHSPILLLNNTVSNNLGVGIYAKTSGADVVGNVVLHNSLGFQADAEDSAHLVANVFANNTIGVSIPYSSRQMVVHLEANVVNGVNIDGALNASQQVYFYHAANVLVTGELDSGFSAGYYGSLTAEGGVVLYDVNTANIRANISNHAIGVQAYNSFNVNVAGSALVNNGIGVEAYGTGGIADYVDEYGNHVGASVPDCVVTVKNSTINVTVDPVGSMGIDAHGCLVLARNTTISLVATGISIDGASSAVIRNVTVTDAQVGLDAQARPNALNVTGSAFVHNDVGARLVSAIGAEVMDSSFVDNRFQGLVLDEETSAKLRGNRFVHNGEGLVDARPCNGAWSCSTLDAAGDLFLGNDGDGMRMFGPATLKNETFDANGGDGADLRSATLNGVRATGNGEDGVEIIGSFAVRNSLFDGNARHGLAITGTGELRRSVFTNNEGAGIRAFALITVTAFDLNVSHNFDGIQFDEAFTPAVGSFAVPALGTAPLFQLAQQLSVTGPDPLDVHRSVFIGNERDAIRAGVATVNATSNYWGDADGPSIDVMDQVGAFNNGVTPTVRFMPFYQDAAMTQATPALLA